MKSSVSIYHNQDVTIGLPGCLDQLGDLSHLFQGKHVAIKPNETWASRDDTTACTQADSVQAMIRYVKRYNPAYITVTGGSGDGQTDEIFRLLGIDRVIQKEGVGFTDHNRPPFETVQLEYGPQKQVVVSSRIFRYDTLVSLAQHKVHWTARVTLTMKNIAMSFPAADYYGHPRARQKHPHNFYTDMHGFIVGMCKRFPIHLGVILGHPAMVGKGPIGGNVFESGLAIAGTDFVAVDAVGARILGFKYVRHIDEAEKQGLGTADLQRIKIVGIPLEQAEEIFLERAHHAVPA